MGDRIESLVRMLRTLGVQSAGFHPEGSLAHVTFDTRAEIEPYVLPEPADTPDPFMSAALELAGQKRADER